MCVLFIRLHYFHGEDLPEKHHTRLYDDKSRVSALSTDQLQSALDRLCRALQTKPKFCSSQDKTNSVLWISKWRNWSSSGSNDGRIGLASVILRTVYRSVITKNDVSRRRMLNFLLWSLLTNNEEWRIRADCWEELQLWQFAGQPYQGRVTSTRYEKIAGWLVGTSTLSQGKKPVGRPCLCQQRFDLTWADVIASGKHRTRSKRLDRKTRRANENQTFAFHFPIQCYCLLVSGFYIMKKCKRTFSSSSLNRIICIFKQFISIFILNLFLNSVCQFKLKEQIQLVFFSYRQIKSVLFPHITKMKLLLCFLTEKKSFFLLIIQSCPKKKIHRTSKREKFHWETSLCHYATFHSYFIGEKEFSSHRWMRIFKFSNEWLCFFLLRDKHWPNIFILTQRIVIPPWRKIELSDFISSNQRKNRVFSLPQFHFHWTKKRSHCPKRITLQQHQIHLLSPKVIQPTKFFFFFFTLSTQTKIISLSNEILSSTLSIKTFSWAKTSMKSWQDRQIR